jgi:hypothetical protein
VAVSRRVGLRLRLGVNQRAVGLDGSPADYSGFTKTIDLYLNGTFNLLRLAAARISRTDPLPSGERGAIVMTASIPIDAIATRCALNPEFSSGSVMGKRYVDTTGAEIQVTKSGAGTLAVGPTPLTLKEAKPLPASD